MVVFSHTIQPMILCSQSNPFLIVPDLHAGQAVAFAGLGFSSVNRSAQVCKTWIVEHGDPDPVRSLESILQNYPTKDSPSNSGWLIMLSYELGRVIEPKAQHRDAPASDFPLAVVQRWEALEPQSPEGFGEYAIGALKSSMGKARYMAAVERTQAYIAAGDIYQANIAHHLQGSFSGSMKACFAELAQAAEPKFGSMMIFDYQGCRHGVASISPELFIECDLQARRICTEPMKGTRPIEADADELRDSIKDRAELDMITDLMRNDLGRVCTLGSVKVIDPRKIEAHKSGVLQASAVIEGRLADGVGFGDILRATFPPGSVTGAPKVRAMQIIDELEGDELSSKPRDSYCGAMMMLDDLGKIQGAVSIRTAHIWGAIAPGCPDSVCNGQFVYPVGAGVVADSDPASEWAETLVKAAVLRTALGIEIEG